MAFEMLVGLQVTDDALYSQYRSAMAPILKRFGGGFRFDLKDSEILKKEAAHAINRVFIIYFADQKSRDGFFSDPEYKQIREKFFEKSVAATTIISEYSR